MRLTPFAALAFAAALTAPAHAALNTGAVAPPFKAPASLGGKEFSFDLSAALKTGPVVLYFYPAAFTKGCTIEAHAFAAAMDQFKALHATVIGVSHDDIATLDKFSVSECRSKFAVAADPSLSVAKQYDAVLPQAPTYANRTSYVIGQDGKILSALTDLTHPEQHVHNALSVLTAYEKARKAP
ncbi:MAG: peroxiredoxin [Candidatus Baltobacteraceae bacterium]